MAESSSDELVVKWVLGESDDGTLPPAGVIRRLREEAARVRLNAYAVASGFQVGSALLTDTGEIFAGCNVEASNGSSICAERTALVKAISEGHRAFVAVCAIADTEAPVTPCGQCRQQLADVAPRMLVLMATTRNPSMDVVHLDRLFPRANFRTATADRPEPRPKNT